MSVEILNRLDNIEFGLKQTANVASLDANGIYTIWDFKRSDGTEYMRSTLSGGTSPQYTTLTWQFYDDTGTTVTSTKVWTLGYDSSGNLISET